MIRTGTLLALIASPLLIAATGDTPVPLSAKVLKVLAGRTAGEPVSCVPLRRLGSTQIVDETAIIYKSSSRIWYVNQPDNGRCTLLRPNRMTVLRTPSSELCANELIMIAEPNSPISYGACSMGKFVPYMK